MIRKNRIRIILETTDNICRLRKMKPFHLYQKLNGLFSAKSNPLRLTLEKDFQIYMYFGEKHG